MAEDANPFLIIYESITGEKPELTEKYGLNGMGSVYRRDEHVTGMDPNHVCLEVTLTQDFSPEQREFFRKNHPQRKRPSELIPTGPFQTLSVLSEYGKAPKYMPIGGARSSLKFHENETLGEAQERIINGIICANITAKNLLGKDEIKTLIATHLFSPVTYSRATLNESFSPDFSLIVEQEEMTVKLMTKTDRKDEVSIWFAGVHSLDEDITQQLLTYHIKLLEKAERGIEKYIRPYR